MFKRAMPLLAACTLAAGCSDTMGPAPEGAEAVSDIIMSSATDPCVDEGLCELDPIEVDGCSEGGCWCDEPWCYSYDDPAFFDGNGDDTDDGTGGNSGGSYTPYDEWTELCRIEEDPDCEHRYGPDMTQAEKDRIRAAIDVIRSNGCEDVAALLYHHMHYDRIGLWDARVTRDGDLLRGRIDPATHNILMWSGYNTIASDTTQNWTNILAHEAAHILLDLPRDLEETQARNIAESCSTGGS